MPFILLAEQLFTKLVIMPAPVTKWLIEDPHCIFAARAEPK